MSTDKLITTLPDFRIYIKSLWTKLNNTSIYIMAGSIRDDHLKDEFKDLSIKLVNHGYGCSSTFLIDKEFTKFLEKSLLGWKRFTYILCENTFLEFNRFSENNESGFTVNLIHSDVNQYRESRHASFLDSPRVYTIKLMQIRDMNDFSNFINKL